MEAKQRSVSPKVSVIVPVYNVEKYIGKCLDSLLEQSMTELEFIIVDDCGMDGSMDIVARYAQRDARIRILPGTINMGVACARNKGMEIARGKYIAFVDSDDWVSKDYFLLLHDVAEAAQADMAKGSEVMCEGGRAIPLRMNDDIRRCLARGAFPGIAYSHHFVNAIYRTEMLRAHKIVFPSLTNGEDIVFLVNALLHANKLVLADNAIYYYFRRAGSASNRKPSSDYYMSIFRHYEMIGKLLKKSSLPLDDIVEYWHYAITMPLFNYQMRLNQGGSREFFVDFVERSKALLLNGGYVHELCARFPEALYGDLLNKDVRAVAGQLRRSVYAAQYSKCLRLTGIHRLLWVLRAIRRLLKH